MGTKTNKIILQVMLTSLSLLVGDYLMNRVSFDKPWIALVTALVLALLNAFLKPILILLTIPATMFTLGLFLLVINAAMLIIARELVPGFHIEGFWAAFWLALFISFVNALFSGGIKVERHKPEE